MPQCFPQFTMAWTSHVYTGNTLNNTPFFFVSLLYLSHFLGLQLGLPRIISNKLPALEPLSQAASRGNTSAGENRRRCHCTVSRRVVTGTH